METKKRTVELLRHVLSDSETIYSEDAAIIMLIPSRTTIHLPQARTKALELYKVNVKNRNCIRFVNIFESLSFYKFIGDLFPIMLISQKKGRVSGSKS